MVGDIPHVFPEPRPTSSPTLPVRALRSGRNINVLDGSPFCSGGLHLGIVVLSGCLDICMFASTAWLAAHPTGRAFPNCKPGSVTIPASSSHLKYIILAVNDWTLCSAGHESEIHGRGRFGLAGGAPLSEEIIGPSLAGGGVTICSNKGLRLPAHATSQTTATLQIDSTRAIRLQMRMMMIVIGG